jgi:hypothetical protein
VANRLLSSIGEPAANVAYRPRIGAFVPPLPASAPTNHPPSLEAALTVHDRIVPVDPESRSAISRGRMAKRTRQRRGVVVLRHASVPLVAFAALAGLFGIHGLSADHMLNTSGAWASMTAPADSSSSAEHDGPITTGAPQQEASLQNHLATMSGCLAALRSQPALLQPWRLATAALPRARLIPGARTARQQRPALAPPRSRHAFCHRGWRG